MATVLIPMGNYINRKIKGFHYISLLAKKCNLYFSKYDVLPTKIIGLDSIKRKLLFVKTNRHKASCCIIDFKEVKTCTVRKAYSSIRAGELKKSALEEFLSTICLCFRFENGKNPIALPFYETASNSVYDIPELEQKAKDWMSVVSRMLPVSIKERA